MSGIQGIGGGNNGISNLPTVFKTFKHLETFVTKNKASIEEAKIIGSAPDALRESGLFSSEGLNTQSQQSLCFLKFKNGQIRVINLNEAAEPTKKENGMDLKLRHMTPLPIKPGQNITIDGDDAISINPEGEIKLKQPKAEKPSVFGDIGNNPFSGEKAVDTIRPSTIDLSKPPEKSKGMFGVALVVNSDSNTLEIHNFKKTKEAININGRNIDSKGRVTSGLQGTVNYGQVVDLKFNSLSGESVEIAPGKFISAKFENGKRIISLNDNGAVHEVDENFNKLIAKPQSMHVQSFQIQSNQAHNVVSTLVHQKDNESINSELKLFKRDISSHLGLRDDQLFIVTTPIDIRSGQIKLVNNSSKNMQLIDAKANQVNLPQGSVATFSQNAKLILETNPNERKTFGFELGESSTVFLTEYNQNQEVTARYRLPKNSLDKALDANVNYSKVVDSNLDNLEDGLNRNVYFGRQSLDSAKKGPEFYHNAYKAFAQDAVKDTDITGISRQGLLANLDTSGQLLLHNVHKNAEKRFCIKPSSKRDDAFSSENSIGLGTIKPNKALVLQEGHVVNLLNEQQVGEGYRVSRENNTLKFTKGGRVLDSYKIGDYELKANFKDFDLFTSGDVLKNNGFTQIKSVNGDSPNHVFDHTAQFWAKGKELVIANVHPNKPLTIYNQSEQEYVTIPAKKSYRMEANDYSDQIIFASGSESSRRYRYDTKSANIGPYHG